MDTSQIERIFFNPVLVLPLVIWGIFWKGWALWKAAGKRQLVWFIILMIFNTLGILEIAYIFYLHRWDIDKGKLLAFLEKKFGKK
jgi:hypothetical protein